MTRASVTPLKIQPREPHGDRGLADVLAYANSREHLLAELEPLDLLIEAQVQRVRQPSRQDDLQGLYISEQEVDRLVAQPLGMPQWAAIPLASASPATGELLDAMRATIQARVEKTRHGRIDLRLVTLAEQYGLSAFDRHVILLCLAAELDLRYERLFSYLQDDVSRKRPSVDLALNLWCASFEAKLEARERFSPGSPLLAHLLIAVFEDPAGSKAALLSRYLKLDDRIISYLLDEDALDERLMQYASLVEPHLDLDKLILPEDMRARLQRLLALPITPQAGLNLYLQGPYGIGKQTVAEAICKGVGLKLLVVDGTLVLSAGAAAFHATIRVITREATLQGAALYWSGFDALLAEDQYAVRKLMLHHLQEWTGMVFLGGEAAWEPADVPGSPFTRIEFPRPLYADRLQFWRSELPDDDGTEAAVLANRFRFTGGQIRDAVATARNLARQHESGARAVGLGDLLEACRLRSNRRLASLATHIKPRYTFADIVLPPDRLRQLHDIRNAVEYRSIVHDEWGFGAKLSLGKGFGLLFAGPSGTGKTMAAEILGHELGLDLYKIDLSVVVSKYIGETEKNLSKIFAEAETSNAILFFDEADALFGKRSEVRDAHDRYANIEINYLLQRIEEYEGVIILASNLRKNMDEAFVRRIHATIEFPFPDAENRFRIWQSVWPAKTPRQGLDLDFMARRFELTGANIRNIALASGFLGAKDGGCVHMEHLIRATRQEYQKMGKVVMEGEFGEYADLAHFS